MAVPAPSTTAATAQIVNVCTTAMPVSTAAWTSMPTMIIVLRPQRPDSDPVMSCPAPTPRDTTP